MRSPAFLKIGAALSLFAFSKILGFLTNKLWQACKKEEVNISLNLLHTNSNIYIKINRYEKLEYVFMLISILPFMGMISLIYLVQLQRRTCIKPGFWPP